MKGTLVIIPCGKAKIWDSRPSAGATSARNAYSGPPFIVNREYAQERGDDWRILSGKYGLIAPDFVIPGNYDVDFKNRATNPISISEVTEQARQERLTEFETIIGLGGAEYVSILREVFAGSGVNIQFPFAGLGLGRGMQAVKAATLELRTLGKARSRTP